MPRNYDVLDHWHDRKQISDDQFEAAKRFRALFEVAGMDGRAVIDATRVKVSCNPTSSGSAEQMLLAKGELLVLREVLGAFDFALISRVIGNGKDLAGDAANEAERRYLAQRIRDGLKMLALRFTYTDLPIDEVMYG